MSNTGPTKYLSDLICIRYRNVWSQSISVNSNKTRVFPHPMQSDTFPWYLGVSDKTGSTVYKLFFNVETTYTIQRKCMNVVGICENCIGDGTDCYLEHPDECRKYIRCSASSVGAGMEALEMNCAFGTFWSNVANTCDLASDVFCEKGNY